VEQFKYSGKTLKNKNPIQEEIACYHSVHDLLSSSLPSKHIKIKIYKNAVLMDVLYECKTWSLTLREERRLRVFETRAMRRYLGLRGTR